MKCHNKPFIILISVILIVFATAFSIAYMIRNYQGIRIRVNFADAKGLSENSPVEYKGIKIGSVIDIEADPLENVSALIKIDPKHSKHLRQNALFVISSDVSAEPVPGILMGYCKEVDPYSSPEMAPGSVINGENSELLFSVKTRLGCFNQTTDNLTKALENLKSNIESILNSPKAQQLYQDIEKFFMDLHKNTQEQIQKFIKEKGPEIEKTIENLIKELEKSGYKKDAEKWEKFLKEELQKVT